MPGSPAADNKGGPDISKIEPLPGTSAPPLPALPGLPGASDTPAASDQPKPEEKTQTVAEATQAAAVKKKKHHHKNLTANKSEVIKKEASNSNYFRSERLPDTIYRKSYDTHNRHLPVAYYERDYDGLVFVTAQHDDINGLRSVLDAGRDMEFVDSEGDTPLLVAIKHNAVNTTRLLLSRHANYNVTDRGGLTPMQIAEQNGNFQIVRAIQAAGASTQASQ